MRKDNHCEGNLDELYEFDYEDVPKQNRSKIKSVFMSILLFIAAIILIWLLKSDIHLFDIQLGDIIGLSTSSDVDRTYEVSDGISSNSKWGKIIDERLKKGDLLPDIVKDYFKEDYGINVTVIESLDLGINENVQGDVRVIQVKDDESGGVYEFHYSRTDKTLDVKDTYGSALTSKLLGEKLTDLYKGVLPKGSVIWVDGASLGNHSDVDNSNIKDRILNASIEELLEYNKEVLLFEGIGVNIVCEEGKNEVDFRSTLLNLADVFSSEDGMYPRLEVSYVKGQQGMNNIMKYLTDKASLKSTSDNIFVKWYDDVLAMGEDVKTNLWGVMSIKTNAKKVLESYYNESAVTYLDEVSGLYLPIYKSADEIVESSKDIEMKRIKEN